jgi:DedD protein
MRGYFDEEETAREPERVQHDTEVTLGAGAMLGIFFGLVLLCGLCFGLGYAVGHRASTPSAAAAVPATPPDHQPPQPNSSVPKPSAAPQGGNTTTTPAASGSANPDTTQQNPPSGSQGAPNPGAPAGAASGAQPVRTALPSPANTAPPPQAAPTVRPALPAPAPQWVVQIAAVSNPEDANVLVMALRRRGYSVTAVREPVDGLIHVFIGPFSSRDEANRWQDKLLGDGYNAVVQP